VQSSYPNSEDRGQMIDLLPTGRRGQFLAISVTILLLATAWFGIAVPLISWYDSRAQALMQQAMLEQHMEMIVRAVPTLLDEARAARGASSPRGIVFDASSDAVAGATLQQTIQRFAHTAGLTLASVETLAAAQRAAFRRIALRVSFTASWPSLIRFLQELNTAEPRVLVDDLQLDAAPVIGQFHGVPLSVSLTILAFRAGTSS